MYQFLLFVCETSQYVSDIVVREFHDLSVGMRTVLEQAEALKEDPSSIAGVYALLGEVDRAFEWVERAFAETPHSLLFVKVSPWSDPVRADPRFKRLLERLGMAD